MRLSSLVFAALIASTACKGGGVQAVQPALQINKTSVTFALTPYGTQETDTVTLEATAAVDVLCTLALDGGAFTISPAGAVTVPGSSSTPVTITFAPILPSPIPSSTSVQEFTGDLQVGSNDPNHPTLDVTLKASAQAPQLDLCWNVPPATCLSQGPLTVEFGALGPRQMGGPVELDLTNLAQVPLTVTGFALDAEAQAAGYAIVEPVSLPITLSGQSGLTDVFHVVLNPLMPDATAGGHVVITSDDPRADGGPVEATLDATVAGYQPPTACLGVVEIDYIDGRVAELDPTRAISAQGAVPPGPLDSVRMTANVSATCSYDPQDHQTGLLYDFTLTTPTDSTAALQDVVGHTEQQTLEFDVPGIYTPSVTVTDSASLKATAQLAIPVTPQSDLEAELSWTGTHQVDLDLHLVRQLSDAGTGGLIDDPNNDCFWCNCLLPVNYPTGPLCGGTYTTTTLQWGSAGSAGVGHPQLVANQGFDPLPTLNIDDSRLTGPQPGATYGLYAHYYQAYAPQADAGACSSDQDCTDPLYAACWGGECVPNTTATLRISVDGQDIFDGGQPPTQELRQPCDLWHAGDITWISGGHLGDGGFSSPTYIFTPATVDGGLGNNAPSQSGLTCGTK